jgi:hypothetical protein
MPPLRTKARGADGIEFACSVAIVNANLAKVYMISDTTETG